MALLAADGWPRDRVVLYAWNPLAVIETAGSGHIEPLGDSLRGAGDRLDHEGKGDPGRAPPWAAAIQAKLFPLILVFGFVRRMKIRAVLAMLAVVALTDRALRLEGRVGSRAASSPTRTDGSTARCCSRGCRQFFERIDAVALGSRAAIGWVQARWGTGDTRIWDALYRWSGRGSWHD